MISLDALLTGILAVVDGSSALTAIHGEKTAFGQFKDGVGRPKCRLSVVGDSQDGLLGTRVFESIRIQFSVFADDLTAGDSVRKALAVALHGVSMTLADSTVVMPRKVEGTRVLVEDQQPTGFVYHAIVVVEFTGLN